MIDDDGSKSESLFGVEGERFDDDDLFLCGVADWNIVDGMDSSSVLMVIFFLDGCSARNDLLLGSNGKLSMPESHRRGPKISSSYCDDKVDHHYPYFLTLNRLRFYQTI